MKRLTLVALLTVCALSVPFPYVASAASIGLTNGTFFGANEAFTNSTATLTVTTLTVTSTGNPARITDFALTITGSNLNQLKGQVVNVALLGSAGALVQPINSLIQAGGDLNSSDAIIIAGTVPGSPLTSSIASWSAIVFAATPLGGGADTEVRAITLGSGAI